MEKVFDVHVHYLFDIPMEELVKIFKEEFEKTGTAKYVFLSIPHHAHNNGLHLSADQNVKGLFLKHAFSPNGYAFAGLIHPQTQISDEERAESYYRQVVQYHAAGFDGIKMLEGHPTLRKAMGIALNSSIYDKYYSYLEEMDIPVIMHVADPAESWDMKTASESAKALGRTYANSFPSKRQLTDEVFAVLEKHPKLKLGLAHFGFFSYDISEAEKFLSYENTFFDITPGGEQLIRMQKEWGLWLQFWEKYQDRILYGTDFYAFPKDENWEVAFFRRPKFVRQLFETNTEHEYIGEKFVGIGLEKRLRDKIYRDNFMRLLGEPKPIDMNYFKNELYRLLKALPTGKEYYTKDGVIDISKPENLEFIKERYIRNINFMLEELSKKE